MRRGAGSRRWRVCARCGSAAGLLPQDKAEVVAGLQAAGERVLVVGDGVNDAPSLAGAELGVAMGGVGSDLALRTVTWDLAATLPLPLGVAGHEGSTILVALNGLRLLRRAAWHGSR